MPIFVTLFNGLDVDLPLPTRIVIALSNFVGSIYGLMIFFFLIGAGICGRSFGTAPRRAATPWTVSC